MGCSPSHSGIIQSITKNAAKPLKKTKAVLPPANCDNGITIPLLGRKSSSCHELCGRSDSGVTEQDNILPGNGLEKNACNGFAKNVSRREDQGKEESNSTADEGKVNSTYQRGVLDRKHARKQSSTGSELELSAEVQQDGNPRRSRKSKGHRSSKQGRRGKAREKQIAFSESEKKVDFPELLVKAHQHAYAYMNPNLSKYEAVISMTNQATQTQVILQQMISFMALRFDEINQCLEEIADDGEKLLKDVGKDLAWPLGKGNPMDQPDLLRQLLQYTANRMQTLNSSVASLTSNALQETCGYLQSAATNLQEKLRVKQISDGRLLRTIKLIEDSAAGAVQSRPNDLTLYSEDSGIGGDNESIKECRSPDKLERRTSQDSVRQVHSGRMKERARQGSVSNCVEGNTAAKMYSKDVAELSSNNAKISKQSHLATSLSMNSLDSSTTLEQDSNKDQESDDCTSSDDSYDDEEDNRSLSSQITLSQRPMTSPAGAGGYKQTSKWLENHGNEEMTLKMKEAISEKIKFVPEKSSSNVWIREEELSSALRRPSTADGSNRRTSRHRRSRSAESLRSQTEDPTLLELQRTQKELSKKLEQLYRSTGSTNKSAQQKSNIKSFLHTSCIASSNMTSTNKLKACLDKSFNILPSQERITLLKLDKSVDDHSNNRLKNTTTGTQSPSQRGTTEEKNNLVDRKMDCVNVSPRQSVRKLIETFSPVDEPIQTSNLKTLGPLRCVRKFGVPVLPPTIPAYRGLEPLDHKSSYLLVEGGGHASTGSCLNACQFIINNPFPICQGHVTNDASEIGTEDFEDFPPPPLEILMDDSFNVLQAKGQKTSPEKVLPNALSSCNVRKTGASQKIKTSVNMKDLLPSKNATSAYTSLGKTFRSQEENVTKTCVLVSDRQLVTQSEQEMQRKHEIEQAAHLYKQSHKIIPLQNPGDVSKANDEGEKKESAAIASYLLKQKQCSPSSYRRSEKSPAVIRRVSPTRTTVPSPSVEKRLTSPPTTRAVNKTHYNVQHSPPPLQKNASPTGITKLSSPPSQRKTQSPPSQRKLQSPPQLRRQASPPSQYRLPSPPSQLKSFSPPSQYRLPSPPSQLKSSSPPSQYRLPSPPSQLKSSSPPIQRRLPSPPNQLKSSSPPSQRRLPSPPNQLKSSSPPSQRRLPSPSDQYKIPSPSEGQALPNPPTMCKPPSPPTVHEPPSPPSYRRLSSPPTSRREPSPPLHSTSSPPLSPSFSRKGLRRSSDEPLPSSKFGNAQSIFCPSSTSLFEAKFPSPPNHSGAEAGTTQATSPILRHSFSGSQYGEQHRRAAMSAINPQPFVRRCYSDRRPRVQLRLAPSISPSLSCESALQHIG
ncbi:photoreceptor cilium actin regulator [Pelodytes ibericus]